MNRSEVDDITYCGIAMEEAANLCSDPQTVFRYYAGILGFNDDTIGRIFPIEEKYAVILDEGLDTEKCMYVTEVNMWVLARAWELFNVDGESIDTAFATAWAEVSEICMAPDGM